MNPALSRYLFSLSQRLSGADLLKRISELQSSEYMPRDQMAEMQWRKMEGLINHAYKHVPYYRRTWNEHGIKLSQIQSLGDLKKLPFLTKSDVQNNFDDLCSEIGPRKNLQYGRTSGSSGTPMNYCRTQDSKARFWAAQYRAYAWYGIRPGDKQGRFYGMPFEQAAGAKEKIKDLVMNRRRLLGMFDLSEARLATFSEQMNRFRPVYFNGYASWLSRFAEFVGSRTKSQYNWIPLNAVVSTSEVLHDHKQKVIEDTFECKVINEYGAAEIGLVAISCPHRGYHTVPENNIVEFALPDNVHALGKDEQSHRQIVITDLHSDAMPFIRYKVGDSVSNLDVADTCSCGRTSQLMGPVQGRTFQYVLTPEGELRHGMIYDYMLKLAGPAGVGVLSACTRQRDIHTITMYIVKNELFTDDFLVFVRESTREHISPTMQIEFEFVDELPRSPNGKLQSFATDIDINAELSKMKNA